MSRKILILFIFIALGFSSAAFADITDPGNLTLGQNAVIGGTLTVSGNGFSVDGGLAVSTGLFTVTGSTFSVYASSVSIGTQGGTITEGVVGSTYMLNASSITIGIRTSSVTFNGYASHAGGVIPGIGFSSFTWITTTETWTNPVPGVPIYIQCWGGGGAAGNGCSGNNGAPGGGGGFASLVVANSAQSYSVTISTGSNAPACCCVAGQTANPTIFGTLLTCLGGKGGAEGGGSPAGGAGGTCTGGTINIAGQTASNGNNGPGELGGAAPFGGVGGSVNAYNSAGPTAAYASGTFPGGGGASGSSTYGYGAGGGAAGACLVWY